ncbi:hypothetical protein FEM03_06210 [Phragmitibacter flavus]|uniref:Uncharacterized protein n=1 Tax=Phragmitibacter flavus TaxID=2576071 RepID=A0A5R8KJD2_9BACT|nr:hypothetical protein FEM03_06210 [Phragmitibacter flavus]
MKRPHDSVTKRLAPLLTHVLLASFIICRRGWAHLDDCLKYRLNLAVEETPSLELVEIDFHPRTLRRIASDGLKEIRWTIKAWTGSILIELGRFLRLVVLAHNRPLKRKMKLLLRLWGDDGTAIGGHDERVGILRDAMVNPNLMNMEGNVFRLVDQRQDDGRRQLSYMCLDDEWSANLHKTPNRLQG